MINLQGKTLGLGGTCFTISKLACKILRRLGYNCFEQRTFVIVGDKIGSEIFLKQAKEGKFDKEEIIKASGWVLGIGAIDTETKRNDFHYDIRSSSCWRTGGKVLASINQVIAQTVATNHVQTSDDC